MRHRKTKYSLNRVTSWRKSTIISIVKNLLKFQKITTTDIRAKACRPLAESLISLARKNTLDGRRRAFKILGEHSLVSLLFEDIGPRFKKRGSGFTRILKIAKRRGDNAQMVVFELTEIKENKKIKPVKVEKASHQEPGQPLKEKPEQEPKAQPETKISEKPPVVKKPTKKFLGGIRNIFKKERDSL
jgi:large subunit ribosomal protein L17